MLNSTSRALDWALAAVLALAPLLPRGATYLTGSTHSYVELILPALALVWVAARIVARPGAPNTGYVAVWPWDLLMAAMAGATVLGLMADNRPLSPVFAEYLRDNIGDLFRPMHLTAHPLYSLRAGLTFFEGWLTFRLVVAICRLAPDCRRRATVALGGWLTGMSVAAAVALLQYATAMHLHPYWVRANPSLIRANSTLDDPNALGAVLVLGIGLLVGMIRLGEPRRRLWWAWLAGLAAVGLVTTMSRSALGAALIAPLGVLAIGPAPTTPTHRRLRLGARVVMAVLAAAIAGSVVLREFTTEQRRTNPEGLIEMVITTFDPRESTGWVLRGRLPWWQASAAMFADRPIEGHGLGRVPRLAASFGGGPMRENTHNLFLQLLAETGVIGFAAFVGLCAAVLITLGRAAASRDGTRQAVALGGLIAVLGFLLTMLTGHTLLLPSGQILFASFMAVVLTVVSPSASNATTGLVSRWAASGWSGKAVRGLGATLALAAVAVVAPGLGAWRGVAPAAGVWGYHSGLHDEEPSEEIGPYRWTTARALVDLSVPDEATTLVLDVTAVYPVRNGIPTAVTVTADGQTTTIELTSSDVRQVRLPVPVTRRTSRRMLVDVTVAPTFVPGAGDTRVLGAQLFRPRFEDDAGRPRP